ncbi:MAG: alpha/beta hydrolase [Dermatophilaceae bacterium]
MPGRLKLTVAGGSYAVHDLSVGDPGPRAPVVVAVHGITANGLWFRPLAHALAARLGAGGVRLLAPCLRGRADSAGVTEAGVTEAGGLGTHAADVAQVCRVLHLHRPVLLGHSMGAWVSALTAAADPAATRGLVLADGALTMPLPAGVCGDALVRATLGPALSRLGTTFEDAAAYRRYWGSHPALRRLGPSATAAVGELADHDLVPAGPRVRSALSPQVVLADARDVAADPVAAGAVGAALAAGVPGRLVWARRGLLDEPQGTYDEARIARLAPDGLISTCVEAANHLSLVLDEPGVGVLADAVVEAIG